MLNLLRLLSTRRILSKGERAKSSSSCYAVQNETCLPSTLEVLEDGGSSTWSELVEHVSIFMTVNGDEVPLLIDTRSPVTMNAVDDLTDQLSQTALHPVDGGRSQVVSEKKWQTIVRQRGLLPGTALQRYNLE